MEPMHVGRICAQNEYWRYDYSAESYTAYDE